LISRKEILHEKAATYLLEMIYVEIFAHVKQNMPVKEAEDKLLTLGRHVSESFYDIFKSKKKTIPAVLKELGSNFGGLKKIKITENITAFEKSFSISFDNCPFCIPEVSIDDIPYCIPLLGVFEGYINQMLKDGFLKNMHGRVQGNVIKSISGGHERCEYIFRLKEDE